VGRYCDKVLILDSLLYVHCVLQCVAVCCSVLQCLAFQKTDKDTLHITDKVHIPYMGWPWSVGSIIL